MACLIGIDEAGYGPNLGPLVVASHAIELPDGQKFSDSLCLWRDLSAGVTRVGDRAHQKLIVDDSKKVYQSGSGLNLLLSALVKLARPCDVHDLLNEVCVGGWPDPGEDPTLVDAQIHWRQLAAELPCNGDEFQRDCRQLGYFNHGLACTVVSPRRFNRIVDQHGTKAAATGQAVVQHIEHWRMNRPDVDLTFCIDRQGGRLHYAPLLQETCPDGWIQTLQETASRCRYRLIGGSQRIEWIIQPKADGAHFNVAAASMAAKAMREVAMTAFNAFWRKLLPNIKPTAGYPVDAKRFFAEIEPTMCKRGIAKDAVWRCR